MFTTSRTEGSGRLDPVRGARPPAVMLRAVAVTALLVLAVGVLYLDPGSPSAPAPPDAVPVETPAGSLPPPEVPDHPADRRLPVPSGLVGVPVRLADPAALAVLRPGDRVDLVALPGTAVLAGAALVLDAVTEADAPVLFVALTEPQARAVLALKGDVRLSVIVRSR